MVKAVIFFIIFVQQPVITHAIKNTACFYKEWSQCVLQVNINFKILNLLKIMYISIGECILMEVKRQEQ